MPRVPVSINFPGSIVGSSVDPPTGLIDVLPRNERSSGAEIWTGSPVVNWVIPDNFQPRVAILLFPKSLSRAVS